MKKTAPTRGQAYIKDGGIAYQSRRGLEMDIDDIDRMIKDAKRIKETSPFYQSYLERMAEKETAPVSAGAYNARLYNYPTGQHVTLYDKSVQIGVKNQNLSKAYRNEDRTLEEEEHCIKVSLNRTKNAIYNIARSNVWKWFITLTISPDKADRSNYDEVVKRLKIFLNHLQQRTCPDLKYLIVPELHLDKTNYHFHGLLADCDELEFVFSGIFDKKGRPVFNIPKWSYGFTTATLVGDTSRASSYITKYVTKESEQYLKNKHRYYANRNTLRTLPEKLVVNDKTDFIETYAEDITFIKDVTVKPANRKCTYIEMPYDIPVKKGK